MKLWLALVACSGGNPPKWWAERPHRAFGLDAIKVFHTSGAGKGKRSLPHDYQSYTQYTSVILGLCPILGSTRRLDAPALLRSLVLRGRARKHLVWAFADKDQACREGSGRGRGEEGGGEDNRLIRPKKASPTIAARKTARDRSIVRLAERGLDDMAAVTICSAWH